MKKRLSVPPTKTALLQVGRQARFLEQEGLDRVLDEIECPIVLTG